MIYLPEIINLSNIIEIHCDIHAGSSKVNLLAKNHLPANRFYPSEQPKQKQTINFFRWQSINLQKRRNESIKMKLLSPLFLSQKLIIITLFHTSFH